MPVPTDELTRLSTGAPTGYNTDAYDATDNPYGFGAGGHITNLFNLSADLTVVANWIATEVASISDLSASVDTVAGLAAEIGAVADALDNITTVADLAATITTVAGMAAAIADVATNAAAAAASASSADTSEGNAAISAGAASDAADAAEVHVATAAGYLASMVTGLASLAASVSTATSAASDAEDALASVTTLAAQVTVDKGLIDADRVAAEAARNTAETAASTAASAVATAIAAIPEPPRRNLIINGDGRVDQRYYSTIADDAYWCDRHYVLTQTSSITPTIISDVENGLPYMMRLTQTQAVGQRIGNATIIEGREARALRGKTVTLGGKFRSSVGNTGIRFAILEHTGTEDVLTSDVINNWTSTTFTAGNFFAAGFNVLATGLVSSFAGNALVDFKLSALVGNTCNNLILVMHKGTIGAQGYTFDMVWGLVEGTVKDGEPMPLQQRSYAEELALCQRRCLVLKNQAFIGGGQVIGTGYVDGNDRYATVHTPVEMAKLPAAGYSGNQYVMTATGTALISVSGITPRGIVGSGVAVEISLGVGVTLPEGVFVLLLDRLGTGAYLMFEAEL